MKDELVNKLVNQKKCLHNKKIILRLQQRLKSKVHNVFIEEINKVVLGSNDNKRLKTFDRIKSYQYDASTEKVCKSELQQSLKIRTYIYNG